MKQLNIILLFWFLIMPKMVLSQNKENTIISIEEIYTSLISQGITCINTNQISIKSLTNSDNDNSFSVLNSSVIEDVINDFKSNWEYIIFNEVRITEVEEDNILVTGTLSGKSYEQGIINYKSFQHTWLIQNGIVIKFLN
ncbi:hypothetical protein [Formosa maritima]|uniref:Uncharacterized protein n=1 Tax=Formosa maritima TaxID=2592046 RepID=A0A5D0GFI7_9FLAO|nr:hypothetical protein [Formosa maritima]TYA57490.1 hypothetical protein FVF61_04490 [Formosa maritima]